VILPCVNIAVGVQHARAMLFLPPKKTKLPWC